MTVSFDVGDLVELSVEFRKIDGTGDLLDPGTVTFRIKEPDGVLTTYVHLTNPQLVRDAVGRYHVNWPVVKSGDHNWRFVSTGVGAAAEQAVFTARVDLTA